MGYCRDARVYIKVDRGMCRGNADHDEAVQKAAHCPSRATAAPANTSCTFVPSSLPYHFRSENPLRVSESISASGHVYKGISVTDMEVSTATLCLGEPWRAEKVSERGETISFFV